LKFMPRAPRLFPVPLIAWHKAGADVKPARPSSLIPGAIDERVRLQTG